VINRFREDYDMGIKIVNGKSGEEISDDKVVENESIECEFEKDKCDDAVSTRGFEIKSLYFGLLFFGHELWLQYVPENRDFHQFWTSCLGIPKNVFRTSIYSGFDG
jgi:hypothetical protein